MGGVVAAEYVSLDGVMQDPGGVGEIERGGWSADYFDDDLAQLQSQLLFASDALLLGRVTYEGFAAAWPSMEETEGEFGVKMNRIPKYVASTTLDKPEWNATLIRGDVPTEVARLKQEHNLLVYGSGALLDVLTRHDLVDQYRLMVHPVVVGQGQPLFRQGDALRRLRLISQRATSKGVVVLDYRPER